MEDFKYMRVQDKIIIIDHIKKNYNRYKKYWTNEKIMHIENLIDKDIENLSNFNTSTEVNNSSYPAQLVCVDNVNYDYLTLGKNYIIEGETELYYELQDDNGRTVKMSKDRFRKLI